MRRVYAQRRARSRAALTLVELLVVIVILATLVSTAIPVIAPGGDDRKIREASRQVNAFFAGAQSRAIQAGRPYGVALKPLSAVTGSPDDNGAVVELSYVEVPPPYAGVDSSSLARIAWNPNPLVRQLQLQLVRYGNVTPSIGDGLPEGYDPDPYAPSFLRPGERFEVGGATFTLAILPQLDRDTSTNDAPDLTGMRWELAPIDLQGYYRSDLNEQDALKGDLTLLVVSDFSNKNLPDYSESPWDTTTEGIESPVVYQPTHDHNGDLITGPDALTASSPIGPFWSTPLPYKIYRQPKLTTAPPLQLPEGVAIDLQASGFANGVSLYKPSSFYDETNAVFLPSNNSTWFLFSPEGTLGRASILNPNGGVHEDTLVTSSLSLLIGRRELIPAEPTDGARSRAMDAGEAADEPIDLGDDLNGLTDEEQQELRNQYNWLHLESRWVVIGAQSGSVTTVTNAFVNPTADEDGDGVADIHRARMPALAALVDDTTIKIEKQTFAARANAPRRAVQGGR